MIYRTFPLLIIVAVVLIVAALDSWFDRAKRRLPVVGGHCTAYDAYEPRQGDVMVVHYSNSRGWMFCRAHKSDLGL